MFSLLSGDLSMMIVNSRELGAWRPELQQQQINCIFNNDHNDNYTFRPAI